MHSFHVMNTEPQKEEWVAGLVEVTVGAEGSPFPRRGVATVRRSDSRTRTRPRERESTANARHNDSFTLSLAADHSPKNGNDLAGAGRPASGERERAKAPNATTQVPRRTAHGPSPAAFPASVPELVALAFASVGRL